MSTLSGKLPLFAHWSAISLTLNAVVWMFLVLLFNVPLSSDLTPSVSTAQSRFWLLTIRQDEREFAFGVLGYCSWGINGSNTGDNGADTAVCVRKVGWKANELDIQGLPG